MHSPGNTSIKDVLKMEELDKRWQTIEMAEQERAGEEGGGPLLQPRHLPGHVQAVPLAHLRNCVGNLEVALGQTSITLKWVSGAFSITSTSNKMKAALDITMWSFLNVGLEKYSGV